jgi:multidrug efflux pump subunit AcrA (membrane-fusion protein)
MFARVTLGAGAHANALTVPVSALDDDGSDRYVYVEETRGKYERRKVQVGRSTESTAEIIGGLKSGERVVTEGAFVLKSEANKDKLKGDD